MGKYPNSKTIQIEKTACDRNNPYSIENLAAKRKALKELSFSAYKIWSYLNMN